MIRQPCQYLVLLFLLFRCSPVFAQEGTWTLSGSAGAVILNMTDVEKDNQNDVDGWNLYENIPIGAFQPLDYALGVSVSGSYRFDRDMAMTFGISNFSKEVATSFYGSNASLELRRTVGSTDFKAGLAYYLPPMAYLVESYVLLEVGSMKSRATARAYGTKTQKSADSTITSTTYDTYGIYDKSKMIVTVGLGATSPMLDPLFMKVEATYKFAKIGKIDGEITQLGVTVPHTTSIDFDYSSFLVTIGVGIVF